MQPLTDFSGGLWVPGDADQTQPQPGFGVPANALLEAENLDYLPSGGIKGRAGRRRLHTDPIPETSQGPFRIHRHYPRVASTKFGPQPPISGFDYSTTGTVAWSDPDNGILLDGIAASAALANGEVTHYLRLFQFDFSTVPLDAVITGIQVDIVRRAVGIVTDANVQLKTLRVPGTGLTPNHATAQQWATDWERVTYGGNGDLWSYSWNVDSDGVRNALSVMISAQAGADGSVAEIDYAEMTIWIQAPLLAPRTLVAYNRIAGGRTFALHRVLEDDGSWWITTDVVQWSPAARQRFVSWPERDATFIFDGANPVLQYTSEHPTVPGLWPHGYTVILEVVAGSLAPPMGPYATLWQNRLWATRPSEIQFSVYACEPNDPTSWQPDIQLSVNDAEGGTITGLVAIAGNISQLLILKTTCLWYFVGDPVSGGQLVRYSQRGCVAPDTVQLCPWGCIYLGDEALWLTDGQTENGRNLSEALATLFRGRTASERFAEAIGVYYPKARQYWLKFTPEAADGYVLHFLGEGPQPKLAWSHMPVMPMQAACVWPGAGDAGELVLLDSDGFVRRADTGSTDDDGTADGQPIPVVLRSGSHILDDRTPVLREGRIVYVKSSARMAAGLTGVLRYDMDNAKIVPFSVAAQSALQYHNLRQTITEQATFGRVVDVRLLNADDGPEFELHRLELDATLRTVRQWR